MNIKGNKRALYAIAVFIITLFIAVPAFAEGDPARIEQDNNPNVEGILQINGERALRGANGTVSNYAAGYVPEIWYNPFGETDYMEIALPLYEPGGQMDVFGAIACSFVLGPGETPFVQKNYDSIKVERSKDALGNNLNEYMGWFYLDLKPDRVNGVYPLGISVRYTYANPAQGNQQEEMTQYFRLYVTILDGIDPNAEPEEEPTPTASPTPTPSRTASAGSSGGSGSSKTPQPKVFISEYTVSPNPVYAGDICTVSATITNTSDEEPVSNILVGYESDGNSIVPQGGEVASYIDEIEPGGSHSFTFPVQALADAEPGPHTVNVTVDYEGADLSAYESESTIVVQVVHAADLAYDEPQFPAVVYAGDSMQDILYVYNKGKDTLYNVAVALVMDGIVPESSAFLGNMEPGSAEEAEISVTVDQEAAGPVDGTYVITYEDGYGGRYEEKALVKTRIEKPAPPPSSLWGEEPADPPETEIPWWAWAVLAAGVTGVALAAAIAGRKKRGQAGDEEVD
ncbi:MAG TPA: hypothetical protein DEB31_00405 [Clostridiales bacterium]|nr:hypothetical protein [Clostridiales bacterium]